MSRGFEKEFCYFSKWGLYRDSCPRLRKGIQAEARLPFFVISWFRKREYPPGIMGRPPMPDQPITYRDAGVDIDEMNSAVLRMKEHVRSTFTPGVLSDLGSFGGIFALDLSAYRQPV